MEMSHSIKVKLIADHEIELLGSMVNIHDLKTIILDSYGKIIAYAKYDSKWISAEDDPDTEHADWCIGSERGPCNCRRDG
jgi:hypothetical protein